MKKIIGIILAVMIAGTLSAQQSNTFKYILNADGGIKAALGATSNVVSTADYVIDKVGSTFYARPGIGTGLTAYSSIVFKTMMDNVQAALTSGGVVFIKAGLYDNLPVGAITVVNDKITIQGAGKNLTKLKLKASADVGVSVLTGLIMCGDRDYTTIKDLELDGNGANQTLIDNGAGLTARLCGVAATNVAETTDYLTVENCYIHDFTCFGLYLVTSKNGIFRNNRLINNYWNNITVAATAVNTLVDHNYCEGSADVSITSYGTDVTISDNVIRNTDGVHGSYNTAWAIGNEGSAGTHAIRNRIINNDISGVNIKFGIFAANEPYNTFISGNYIYGLTYADAYGIKVDGDTIQIVGNKISNMDNGIWLHNAIYTMVSGNLLTLHSLSYGVYIEGTSTQNKVIGNSIIGGSGISLASGVTNNYVIGNILNGKGGNDLLDNGTGDILKSNYGITAAEWFRETGSTYAAVTPTSNGLSSGLIKTGSQFIYVSTFSTDPTYICCLPTTDATTIGQVIRGRNNAANGFELRVIAAQATSVYINGVTTNVEAAIPAGSSFEITCIDATHWILKAWTALGAPITAIVPDAV